MSNLISEANQILQFCYSVLLSLAGAFDPVGSFYGVLAGTYGSAAIAAAADDHRTLRRCYLIFAVLYVLIATAHCLDM